MTCPKCGFEQEEAICCLACGIVVAKFLARQALEDVTEEPAPEPEQKGALGELLLPSRSGEKGPLFWGRLLLLVLAAVWGARLVFSSPSSNAAGESLLHLVNLPFHEAGHLFLRPFGPFISSLGGTLGQLLVPLLCLGTLLVKTRDPFGASLCLWWFGENFLDIAPYINDARAGRLPLLGGNTGADAPYGFHDWEYLLTETGLLRFDHLLAGTAHLMGALLILLALAWGALILLRQSSSPSH